MLINLLFVKYKGTHSNNFACDVFVREKVSGVTVRLSLHVKLLPGNARSWQLAISLSILSARDEWFFQSMTFGRVWEKK